jgi:hypothetical protein
MDDVHLLVVSSQFVSDLTCAIGRAVINDDDMGYSLQGYYLFYQSDDVVALVIGRYNNGSFHDPRLSLSPVRLLQLLQPPGSGREIKDGCQRLAIGCHGFGLIAELFIFP